MKPIFLFLAVLIAGAVLASCATLSEAECQTGDWRSIGIADGANGRPASYVDKHISACSEYGITLDRQSYEAGRQWGLTHYCRLDRAEEAGRDGDTYYGVCEGELGVSFQRVYAAAREVYDLEAQYNSAESELDSLIDQIAQEGLTDGERQALRLRAMLLQSDLRLAQNRISTAERRLADIRRIEEQRLSRLGISY
ncbi:DUF2799 domain-containing protein [Pelagibacterium xiamenense]|uniref:DUF2799 domain-containing protein n=1 Tax=Pelagibacterium xiamenense TaxID=2901140 RepID=UPI001E2E1805|nr:DUF2799 domain-containing protein [Pelagibacterium xiamenense]MCD7058768.1 DUF2799 domain-containing protein [Pelagibacterium xiamenense]